MTLEFLALVEVGLIFEREKLESLRSKLEKVPEHELTNAIEAEIFDRLPRFSH